MMALDKWFPPVEGAKRTLTGPYAVIYGLIAAGFAIWYMYTSGFGLVSSETNRGFYLLFTAVLVFLGFPARRRAPKHRPSIIDFIFVALAVASIGYWMNQYVPYAINRVSDPNQWDLIMGAIAMVVVLETSRRVLGIAIPIIAILFLLQLYFGPYLPGKLSHSGMPVDRIIEFTFSTQEAMFGVVTATFATFVFPFMIFGAFLQRSGAGTFFMDLATALTGQWRGGPAKIATLSSALFGSISGSAVSNVVSTGVITIPLMRRGGYEPKVAGAFEAVASTGGQLMPPLMGASAFVMAEFLEIPYADVVLAALIPAFLYYLALFVVTDLEAAKIGIARIALDKLPNAWQVLRAGWFFPLPFGVLIYGLFGANLRPEEAALYAVLTLLICAFVFGYDGKRAGPMLVLKALEETGRSCIELLLIVAVAGLMIGLLNTSGLGFALTYTLVEVGGGNLAVLLVLAALICIVLGMGMPTLGVYVLVAALVAPSLVELGVDKMAAHLFVLYFGMMSMITPPVAIAAFAAATVAGSDPMKTAAAAVQFGWSAYIVPFMFVVAPELMMQGPFWLVVQTSVTAIFGVWMVSAAFVGYFSRPLDLVHRAIFAIAGILMMIPASAIENGAWTDIAGAVIAALLVFKDVRGARLAVDAS